MRTAPRDRQRCHRRGLWFHLRLRDAGRTAYNHNLDTSRSYYPHVVSTRTYDERLATLRAVARAGIAVCCGAILGMGET